VWKKSLATLFTTLVAAVAVTALAAPAHAAVAVHYVALGDSYASGVGAGSYISASGSCQRSLNAFSQLWANTKAPTSYTSVACSGATTASVLSGQLSALSTTTTLVSVVVGGNDVGFADIMSRCALQGTTECVNAVQIAENKAQTLLPGLLDNVYNGISARAPQARVVVVGYPVFYQLGVFGCIGLTETSRAKINEGINMVDTIIQAAATRHGFAFADVRSAFVGHQLCSGDKWMHALNFASLSISYHPMASGQANGYLPTFTRVAG
jgi:lysophospholipase L1-like esterase